MKKSTRIISLFLIAIMFLSMFSVSSFAAETESDIILTLTDRNLNSVSLKWNEIPDGTKYEIQRSTDGGKYFERIGYSNDAEYLDSSLKSDTEYTYRVRSCIGLFHFSDFSNTVIVMTSPDLGTDLLNLGVGNIHTFGLKKDCEYIVNSSDDTVVSISSDGVVKALKEGSAVISVANSDNGKSVCSVNVLKAPSKISLNKTKLDMGLNEGYSLTAKTDYSLSVAQVKYTSSDESIASVDDNGKVIANKKGSATITAKTYNGLSATCAVIVKDAPSSVSFNVPELELGIGGMFDLNTKVNSGAGAVIRTFSSDNPTVASVDASGIVKGILVGTAVITTEVYNGVSAKCVVTVSEKTGSIDLSKYSAVLGVGEKYSINARLTGTSGTLSYSSNNKSVATVNSTGIITAVGKGDAVITVKSSTGLYSYFNVSVKAAPKSLTLNKTKIKTMGIGEKYKLKYTLSSGSVSSKITFTSSNKKVVTVDGTGMLTAKGEGNATITVSAFNGVKASCVVYVKKAPKSIDLNYTKYKLSLNTTVDLDSKVNSGAGGYYRAYTTDNSEVATVNSSGVVTGKSVGNAKVTVTLYNGVKKDCLVEVVDQPASISYKYPSLTMGVGEEFTNTVNYTGGSESSHSVKYSTSNDKIATVDSNGKITAKKVGTATVSAVSANGLKTTSKITVKNAPSSISFPSDGTTLYVGDTYTLKAKLPDNTASLQREWSSSNKNVATVKTNGVITAKAKGTATITVKTFNGKKDTFKVTVKIVNYKKAYTSARVNSDIKALQKAYPDIIELGTIGKSAKGADIPLLKLGKGSQKALICAGIHSREYLTVGFTMRSIEEYAQAYYSSTGKYGNYDMKELLDRYTLYIVPVINPDGMDIVTNKQKTLFDKKTKTTEYKGNANGVNLNRNFPFAWDKITNGSTLGSESYKGKSAGSEPETKALMQLCKENNFNWMISMHLYGNNVFWRDDKNGVINGDKAFADKLNKVCGFVESPSTKAVNDYGGGFENWFRSTYKKPGLCVELVALDKNYRYEISKTSDFDKLTNWTKTKYTFIQGML